MQRKVVLTLNIKPNFSSQYMLKLNVLFSAAVALILLHRITGNSDGGVILKSLFYQHRSKVRT